MAPQYLNIIAVVAVVLEQALPCWLSHSSSGAQPSVDSLWTGECPV
jgi:hypothetical protein